MNVKVVKARRGESLKEVISKRFGQLVVVELLWEIEKSGKRRRKARCLCDCGNKKTVNIAELENGDTKSCGCLRKETNFKRDFIDLTGQIFGNLVVLKYSGPHKKGGSNWRCRCSCGKETIVRATRLKNGMTKSCGCYQKCSGKEHWNWNKSITKEQREAAKRGKIKDVKYDFWRKSVFERDGFKCAVTGKKGDLEAHHLNAWNSHPDQRYDLDNGITLSKEIHKLFHKVYGKGNNTLEQFKEFKLCLTCFA